MHENIPQVLKSYLELFSYLSAAIFALAYLGIYINGVIKLRDRSKENKLEVFTRAGLACIDVQVKAFLFLAFMAAVTIIGNLTNLF